MPTNPNNDDFINNFFSDINLDSNRRNLIDLIYKIYDYKTYLNDNPEPKEEDFDNKFYILIILIHVRLM